MLTPRDKQMDRRSDNELPGQRKGRGSHTRRKPVAINREQRGGVCYNRSSHPSVDANLGINLCGGLGLCGGGGLLDQVESVALGFALLLQPLQVKEQRSVCMGFVAHTKQK